MVPINPFGDRVYRYTSPIVRFFDSHAHLNLDEYDEDRASALARARDAGVTRIVNVGIDPGTSRFARRLAEEEPGLHATAAIHPNYVAEHGDAGFGEIAALVREGGFVAVGETGLDYYRDHSPPEAQRESFRRHLALAGEVGLPTVVHCRDAYGDALRILREEAERRDLADRVVMHCWGGTAEEAADFLELGAWISFAGVVTFKNARSAREAAAAVPIERTMVETDCPFLAPQPRRGKRNEPAWVVWVAEEIARVHGVSAGEAARATTANACRAFGVGGDG